MSSDSQKQWAIYPTGWVFAALLGISLVYLASNPTPRKPDVSVTLVPAEQKIIEVPAAFEVQYFTVEDPQKPITPFTVEKQKSADDFGSSQSQSQEGETGTSSWTLEDHFGELLEKARVEIWGHPHQANCEVTVIPSLHPLNWTILAEAFWLESLPEWCLIAIYPLLLNLPEETQLSIMAHELGHILLKDSYPENEEDPYHSLDLQSIMFAVFELDEDGKLAVPQPITTRDRELYNAKWPPMRFRLSLPVLSVD